jgi:hypothetical protein
MKSRRWPGLLASVALLFAGLTNAHSHLHVCLDGAAAAAQHEDDHSDGGHGHEPSRGPAPHAHDHSDHSWTDETVLAQWAPHHAELDAGAADHADVDVDIPNQALAKTLKLDQAAIAPAGPWQPLAYREPAETPAARAKLTPHASPPFVRPLLRGPPR